jgi:MYXO-CTERM domain-containing protein
VDVMTGSAANCNVICSNNPIVSCANGDGCCPAGCDHATDDDCSASCGDGVVDPAETCDPPESCPADCDDQDPCTDDLLTGSSANCNVACSNTAVVACVDGDGCCPAGCDEASDNDCELERASFRAGCKCRSADAGSLPGLLVLVALGLFGMRRRRRRGRK